MYEIDNSSLLPDGLPRILPPYEDGIFQAILTLPESREALRSAVAAFLDRTVQSVTLRNNAAPKRDKRAKQEQYDINCVVDGGDGDQCNVEMQATQMKLDNIGNEHVNIRCRSVFNLCDLHAAQEGKGLAYGDFARSYQVTLCKYRVFREKQNLVERFTFRTPEGKELCDAVTAIFIDLSQAEEIAKKPVSEMTPIERWAVFFALGNVPEYYGIIDDITKQEEGIAVAKETLSNISRNPDERARFHSRRIWLQDREHENAAIRKEVRLELEPVIASKDAIIADKDAIIADKDAKLADKGAKLADKDAIIAKLTAQLDQMK